jgi:peptidoglycan-N-acetylglucosamine deacetylase
VELASPQCPNLGAVAEQKTAPAYPGPSAPTPKHVFRRRRLIAGVISIVAIALLTTALSSHRGHASGSRRTHLRLPATAPKARTHQQALLLAAENRAIDSVLSYTPAVVRGGSKGKEVALTFDDGPGPYTQRLLATLEHLHVPATFFAVGSQEQYFSAGTAAEIAAGDAVEDHSETHPMMAMLSAHDQYEQLFEPIARVEIVGGPRPRLFRPPYGSFDATTFKQLHRLHLLMVLWSVDTSDYEQPGVNAIVHRALAGATPGAIILMHDGGGDREQTIAALPAIVRGLRARGLRPVTVPRLLLDDPPPPGQPIPPSLVGG